MSVMKLALIAFAALLFGSASASAITVKKRTEAPGLPPQIWEIVGDFCAIKSWHPAVEDCVQTKEGDVVFRTLTLKGGGAIKQGTVATKVYAKIIAAGGTCSASPPAGSANAVPDASGDYNLGLIGAAQCSSSAPYPDNKICVWAEYPISSSSSSGGSVTYDLANSNFTGKCQTNVTC